MWNAVERDRLISLMDKLAAVQMDLKPLCNRNEFPASSLPRETTIAEACHILRTATDDLRQVIRSLDGFPGMDPPTHDIGSDNP